MRERTQSISGFSNSGQYFDNSSIEKTNLDFDVVLASFEGSSEKLGKRIRIGLLNARRPRVVTLVAEEHVAVVGIDGAGEFALVHLRSLEPKLDLIGGGGGGGGDNGRRVLCSSGHGGRRERERERERERGAERSDDRSLCATSRTESVF